MKMIQFVFLTVISLLTTTVYAHPGEHGMNMTQFIEHLMSSGFHMGLIVAVVFSLVVIVYLSRTLLSPRRARRSRR